ncbi:winged helix-turn-helix domain-containing protein [Amycolatopsis thermoflava]|uniref:winged helix-turn-helix domain-containing protein n=1 Tax=Amycolatopsis thermoflava TaxID=84480 RepID=UPI00380F22F4
MTSTTGQVFRPITPSPRSYLHEALAEHFRQAIRSGELPYDTAFPSERKAAEMMRVSLGTYRRAVKTLTQEGLVTAVQSKGTFVVYQPPQPR